MCTVNAYQKYPVFESQGFFIECPPENLYGKYLSPRQQTHVLFYNLILIRERFKVVSGDFGYSRFFGL